MTKLSTNSGLTVDTIWNEKERSIKQIFAFHPERLNKIYKIRRCIDYTHFISFFSESYQCLKQKFCLSRSIDQYDTDTGGQATYHDGHTIAFSLWPKWIRTSECGILVISKTSVRSLQIRLYSVFFKRTHETHTWKNKKFDCQRKITFFYFHFSSIATLKKRK